MRSLREQVDDGASLEAVLLGLQQLRVAGERGRVAADQHHARRARARDLRYTELAEPAARRIGHDYIGPFRRPRLDGPRDDSRIATAEVDSGITHRCRTLLDEREQTGGRSDRGGEQSDAAV